MAPKTERSGAEVDFTQRRIFLALKHKDHPKLPLEVVRVSNGYVVGFRRQPWSQQLGPQEPYLEECVKIQYVKSRDAWKLYWKRADLKWHGYGEYSDFEDAIKEINTDPHGCFFG